MATHIVKIFVFVCAVILPLYGGLLGSNARNVNPTPAEVWAGENSISSVVAEVNLTLASQVTDCDTDDSGKPFRITPSGMDWLLERFVRSQCYRPDPLVTTVVDVLTFIETDDGGTNYQPQNFNHEDFKALWYRGGIGILNSTVNGSTVIYVNPQKCFSESGDLNRFKSAMVFMGQQLFDSQDIQIYGIIVIVDFDGFGYTELICSGLLGDISFFENTFKILFPLRVPEVHLIDPFWGTSILLKFLPEAVRDTVVTHDKCDIGETLMSDEYRSVSPRCIGGDIDDAKFIWDDSIVRNVFAGSSPFDRYWDNVIGCNSIAT